MSQIDLAVAFTQVAFEALPSDIPKIYVDTTDLNIDTTHLVNRSINTIIEKFISKDNIDKIYQFVKDEADKSAFFVPASWAHTVLSEQFDASLTNDWKKSKKLNDKNKGKLIRAFVRAIIKNDSQAGYVTVHAFMSDQSQEE